MCRKSTDPRGPLPDGGYRCLGTMIRDAQRGRKRAADRGDFEAHDAYEAKIRELTAQQKAQRQERAASDPAAAAREARSALLARENAARATINAAPERLVPASTVELADATPLHNPDGQHHVWVQPEGTPHRKIVTDVFRGGGPETKKLRVQKWTPELEAAYREKAVVERATAAAAAVTSRA